MRISLFIALFAVLLLGSSAAMAITYNISSGTGFFVSKRGYIITNEHVVQGCDTVTIRGAVPPTEARVIAVDTDMDLALLASNATPAHIAHFRYNTDNIKSGDDVLVIGYPEQHGISGNYKIVQSKIIDVVGPLGRNKWLQFMDSARQGNSGGPLLDLSGNVIGVIVGKATLTKTNLHNGRQEIVQESDIAINISFVTEFLNQNNINIVNIYSSLHHTRAYIEQMAKYYIVNIHCRQ